MTHTVESSFLLLRLDRNFQGQPLRQQFLLAQVIGRRKVCEKNHQLCFNIFLSIVVTSVVRTSINTNHRYLRNRYRLANGHSMAIDKAISISKILLQTDIKLDA